VMRTSTESSRDYFREAASWSNDRERENLQSRKIAWFIASAATIVALVEGIALASLLPLKTVVPYTLLVDRHTGYVETLRPLEQQKIAPDEALVHSLLAQYVTAREQFDIATLRADYRKVGLWSASEARDRYIASIQASNNSSPLNTLPRQAVLQVEVLSVSSLNTDTALVRFTTQRADGGGRSPTQNWVATVTYRFSAGAMSTADRYLNPLGFQVTRYRRNAEAVPLQAAAATPLGAVESGGVQ
jgi:type IV secretion system protein VirB8